MIRRALFILCLLSGLAGSVWLGSSRVAAQVGSGAVADLLSWALSTPTTQLSIGAVEGALSSDITIRDVKVSDRDGVWLTLDRARLVWSRTALFARRLDIQSLEVGTIAWLRRPLASDPEAVAGAPSLPDLPVRVSVGAFDLARFELGASVLGAAATLTARGSARLGPPAEGLRLDFSAERLDAAGRFLVKLGYVPETTRLDLAVDLDEAGEGLLSRVLDIPGAPPVRLSLTGAGPLDDWSSTLSFAAGPDIGAEGAARLRRSGTGRDLTLDLSARLAGLLPETIAPIFGGQTTLAGSLRIGDDGALAIHKLDLVASAATVSIAGTLDADRVADLRLEAAARPTDGARTRAGAAEIAHLSLRAALTGPLAAPRLEGRLDGADLRLPSFSLASLESRLDISPVSGAGGAERFSLAVDAKAKGLRLADRAKGEAVGENLAFVGRGTLGADWIADLADMKLTADTGQARFSGELGYRRLDGQAELTIPRLEPLSGLAGTALSGAAVASARLTGNPSVSRLQADLDARASDLSTGLPRLDALLGQSVTLKGGLTRLALGFGFDKLTLAGRFLQATLDGVATRDAASVSARLVLPELQRLDPRLSGRGQAEAKLTGSLTRPDLAARAEIADARMLGRPVPRLSLELAVSDLRRDLVARLKLDGEVDKRSASGRLTLSRAQEDGWDLRDLDFRLGSVDASGDMTLAASGLAAGRLVFAAGNLDDLSALALTPLAGKLSASAELTIVGGGQNADVKADGAGLRLGPIGARSLKAAATLRDLYRRPALDGAIETAGFDAFGLRFDTLRAGATSAAAGSDLTLTATSAGFDLKARGFLASDTPIRFELAAFEAKRGGRRIDLARPARFTAADGAVAVQGVALRIGDGRLTLDGSVGRALDLRLEARAIPLAAADIFAPGLGLGGRLDAEAVLSGPAAEPSGRYRLTVQGLTSAASKAAGAPPANLSAEGSMSAGRIGVEASLALPRSGVLRLTGSAPLSLSGHLDLALRGPLDLALFSAPLAARGQSLKGRLALDLAIRGPLAKPALAGSATLTQGGFADYLQGVRVEAIAGRFLAQGDAVTIERLVATTPNGGALQASGRIAIDPAGGFPADIRITGTRAQLVSDSLMALVADLATTLSGPLLDAPRLSGRIDVVSLEIDIGGALSGIQGPLPGTRHVDPPPEAAALLALEKRARAGRRGPPFRLGLDLDLAAPDTIHVRGRGLNATLGGRMRVAGTSAAPVPTGAFQLRQGALSLPGRRIDLVQGTVLFAGDLRPSLDFVAETQAAGITARITVSGPADKPDFEVSSIPALPQDEVLSRLLFGRAAGGLTGFQALQLAQTVAVLSGSGGGLDGLRRSLGLDALDLSAGASGDPAVGLSRALSSDVRIGVEAGAKTDESGVRVDMGLGKGLRLQGSFGLGGGASIGIGTEREY